MASALASPPPLFSRGSADLKTNARKFLERALVISALVHLAAVGAFRSAQERFAATEEEVRVDVRHWSDPTIITPPLTPIPEPWRPTGVLSKLGEFVPRANEPLIEVIDRGGRDLPHDPVLSDARGGPSERGDPPRGPEGPEKTPAFISVDIPPVPIVAPRPAYPPWAKEAGIEGKVLVRVLVGTDGIPKKAVIVGGPKGLTEGVVDAVLRWRFKPGLANKVPVEVWVEIPISFRLGE